MDQTDKTRLRELVIEQLRNVYDPEIPVNIYELGLIYEVNINDNNDVHVLMTLTAPNCPEAESLPDEIRKNVMTIAGIRSVEVEITFDPPWDQELMSDEAKLELGLL